MDIVAGQAVAAAELGNFPAQHGLGAFQPIMLVAAFGEADKVLLDQRRDRSTALGGDDAGAAIGSVVQ